MAASGPEDSPKETPQRRPDLPGAALGVIERYRPAIEGWLRALLDGRDGQPYGLIRYQLGWVDAESRSVEGHGGKLLRPALCLLCCEATGGDLQRALPAAGALELLHNFTLVHDDVEDESATRHGRQTLWRLWGEAQAINAGDGMFALAQAALLRLADEGHPAERVVQAARMLDAAAIRLCEGQHLDLAGEARDHAAYVSMIEGKTAALMAASCGIGALAGGADEAAVAALSEFGRRLGLAFQVRDDVLGMWGDPQETGKPASDDLRAGKRSFPVVVALERASAEERRRLEGVLGNDGASDSDLDGARALLEELGARDEGERAAREHSEAAAGALRGLELEPRRQGELEQLARFASERSA